MTSHFYKELIMHEAMLAFENKLSRKTLSVTRDSKRDQVIVVEQVSVGSEATLRTETYYRIYPDQETVELNDMIQDAKDYATRQFMGVETLTEAVPQCDSVTPKSITDAPTKQETEKAERVAKKVATKKAPAKKAATKKAAKKAVEATPAPAVKAEEPFSDDDLGAMSDAEPKAEILYNKGNREHASQLKPILLKSLGQDWKTDTAKMSLARALISKLNGSVGVTDVEGEVLESFKAFCTAQLK